MSVEPEVEQAIERSNFLARSKDCRYFEPFPASTISLLVAPSYSGKSTFLKNVIERQRFYFKKPITRVVVVNCRAQISFYELERQPECPLPLPVVDQFTWDTYDPDDLRENDLVILEDLQEVNSHVRQLATAITHHSSLCHLFIICHGILGTKHYELLKYVHRVVLFTQSSAVTDFANYLLQRRFSDPDLKVYLKKVLAVAERQKAVLTLEINQLPPGLQPHHLAVSNLLRLADDAYRYCLVYAYPASSSAMYDERSSEEEGSLRLREIGTDANGGSLFPNLPPASDLIEGCYVVLRPDAVEKLRADSAAKSATTTPGCLTDRERWDTAVHNLERDVENFIPHPHWKQAKNLLQEILKNPDVCILRDGRRMRLKSDAGCTVTVLDYIWNASRRQAPNESSKNKPEFKAFRCFTRSLLDNYSPASVFKNKGVLPNAATMMRKRARSSSPQGRDRSLPRKARRSAETGGGGGRRNARNRRRRESKRRRARDLRRSIDRNADDEIHLYSLADNLAAASLGGDGRQGLQLPSGSGFGKADDDGETNDLPFTLRY